MDKLRNLVDVRGLIYAGSHGFDIEGPNHMRYLVASEFLPKLAHIRDRFQERVRDIPGAAVEDNCYSVTVHYRNVPTELVDSVAAMVREEASAFPELKICEGKMVYEVRPDVAWDKGKAVLWLLAALGLEDREDVYTIYIGDDKTDEDVFEVLVDPAHQTDRQGMGIVVSDERKFTGASMVLRDPEEVYTFLSRLLQYGKREGHVSTLCDGLEYPDSDELGLSDEYSSDHTE